MVIYFPFTRWVFQKHPRQISAHGGFYYLVPVQGPRIRAAEARAWPCGHLYYRVCPEFHHEYEAFLGLPQALVWQRKRDLVKWLEACIHNSFLRQSTGGVAHCWYQKCITDADLQGQMIMPPGLHSDIGPVRKDLWVLLKLGAKVQPVRIVNNIMRNGWIPFRRAHHLQAGFKLILICDRKWIFTVIVLDAANREVLYDWSAGTNPYWRGFHVPETTLRTALLPLVVRTRYPLIVSGYEYLPSMNSQQEFERCIQPLLQLPLITSTVIHMATRQWPIPIMSSHLSPLLFGAFLLDLQLQYGDYVVVALMTAREIRVVVLDGTTRSEKIYQWF